MFKYLWIIMLGIIAIIFLAYTGFVLKETIKEVIEASDEDDTILDIMSDLWFEISYSEHIGLCTIWAIIIIAGLLALFILSIHSFSVFMEG